MQHVHYWCSKAQAKHMYNMRSNVHKPTPCTCAAGRLLCTLCRGVTTGHPEAATGHPVAYLYVSISRMMGPCSNAYCLAKAVNCSSEQQARQPIGVVSNLVCAHLYDCQYCNCNHVPWNKFPSFNPVLLANGASQRLPATRCLLLVVSAACCWVHVLIHNLYLGLAAGAPATKRPATHVLHLSTCPYHQLSSPGGRAHCHSSQQRHPLANCIATVSTNERTKPLEAGAMHPS